MFAECLGGSRFPRQHSENYSGRQRSDKHVRPRRISLLRVNPHLAWCHAYTAGTRVRRPYGNWRTDAQSSALRLQNKLRRKFWCERPQNSNHIGRLP